MVSMTGPGFSRPQVAVAALACCALLGMILVLAAAPIRTNDAWFHLGAGRAYVSEGLWPAADPMLHTAHAEAPVQHEWLFGVGVYAAKETVGFYGLRVLHASLVLLTTWIAWLCFRRAGLRGPLALAGTTAFLVLAWWRLIQLRPDLVSIPAALATFVLLLAADRPPPPRRIAAAALIALFWANAHSLFAIGPALLIAALLGIGMRAALARSIATSDRKLAGRWALAVCALIAVGALNPRGFEQHLTFFTSSSDTAIWWITDEWRHFDPFTYPTAGPLMNALAWFVANVAMASAGVLAAYRIWRAWRTPGPTSSEALDVTYLGLATAGSVALLTSIRFLWMGIFPLLFVLRGVARLPNARASLVGWSAAGVSCALLIAFPSLGGYAQRARTLPNDVATWWTSPYSANPFYTRGIEFLMQTDLQGNLFNRYTLGGYLGYWFAPELRTFVDGRTEHYPREVLDDYFRIAQQLEVNEGESALEALDRREVDIYFGVGLPVEGEAVYTTSRLDGAPGWVQVSRSVDHSIFVRDNNRNRENLARVTNYYAQAGISFDPIEGFDPLTVANANPEWAIENGVVPPDYLQLTNRLHSDDLDLRIAALDRLSILAYLLGDYDRQIRWDREILAIQPKAIAARRRLTHGLLLRGESDEATLHSTELMRSTRGRPPATRVLRMVKEYEQYRIDATSKIAPEAAVHGSRLLTRGEMAGFYQAGAPKLGDVPHD